MSADTSPAEDSAPVARAERRLRLLEELTEIGMELARKLRDGVDADSNDAKTPADAYARLSRAIRLTIALEARTDQALADLKAGIVHAADGRRASAAPEPGSVPLHVRENLRRDEVAGLVMEAIEAETADEEAVNGLYEALEERLDEDEAYHVLFAQPLRQTVERLCRDLCLVPDWSRWREAEEDWAPGYAPIRPPWSPFNTPSPRPILRGQGECGPPASPGITVQTPP